MKHQNAVSSESEQHSSRAHKTFSLVLLYPENCSQKTQSRFFLKVQELPLVNILLGFTFIPIIYQNIISYFVIKNVCLRKVYFPVSLSNGSFVLWFSISSFSLSIFLFACILACTSADFVFFTLERIEQCKRYIKTHFYIAL